MSSPDAGSATRVLGEALLFFNAPAVFHEGSCARISIFVRVRFATGSGGRVWCRAGKS